MLYSRDSAFDGELAGFTSLTSDKEYNTDSGHKLCLCVEFPHVADAQRT